MPETDHSQRNLASLLTRMGNVESMLRFTVAASDDVKLHVEEALSSKEGAADIYLLLADGPKSQPELVKLHSKAQATVSKILTHLVRCGLVARDSNPEGKGYIWRWSDVEEIVKVSKIAHKVQKNAQKSN